MSNASTTPAGEAANNLITVHVIFQAHLDPIFLWPWQAGLDAVLATCRSACDRLDAHPDIYFTRGEAWTYWQIERVDPHLFGRIRKHIEAGRWEIIGGWWIQPDCNLPSDDGMRRQIELGKDYFLDRFGQFPQTAYNVDSFGHAATLPTILRAAGQTHYVMMRPQEQEMALPARLFRWREKPGAPEVITFRIAGAYSDGKVPLSITELPEGIRHTMCFMGIGDHGGGPNEWLIAWCREHRDAFPGCRLEFSTVKRFFDAVAAQTQDLPLHTGELQHHAVGCYSVYRPIKLGVRRGEQVLKQAEFALEKDPAPQPAAATAIYDAWRDVCFNQFHDTLGGTCIPSAYTQVHAQIGRAMATADDLIHASLRRQMALLPDDRMQRIILLNASDRPFDDYVEVEPWLNWQPWQPHWRLLDPAGASVPYQRVETEALTPGLTRLLVRLSVPPKALHVLRIDRSNTGDAALPPAATAQGGDLRAGDVSLRVETGREMQFGPQAMPLPTFQLIDDPTDTWSHDIDRYGRTEEAAFIRKGSRTIDSGPLMASAAEWGDVGHSAVHVEYRVIAGLPYVEMIVRVLWAQRQKVLKLSIPFPGKAGRRRDAIMGGDLERPLTGKECPFGGWTLVDLAGGLRVAIVCADAFGMDCTTDELRLTLLRSPYMAHHFPYNGPDARGHVCDQGEHVFRLRLFVGAGITADQLQDHALMLQRPLAMADLTRGMPLAD